MWWTDLSGNISRGFLFGHEQSRFTVNARTVLQGDELEYLGDFAIRLITVFTIRHSIRF